MPAEWRIVAILPARAAYAQQVSNPQEADYVGRYLAITD